MIGRVRLRHARELVVLPPVEAARFDDHAAHGVAVAADELRGRVNHEIGAVLEGPAEIGRGQRVVDNERHTVALRDLCDRFEIEHDAAGVGQSLAEEELDLVGHRPLDIFGLRHVDEMAGPAELLEAHAELGERAAIEIVGRDELVAALQQRRAHQELRRMAGRCRDGAAPVLQRRDPLLEHGDGGVGDARIDVAEGL